jgi:hypothetical protein
MDVKLDVFGWIPQGEVPNPVHSLPGGTGTWGQGACGPFFGGDGFVLPPAHPSGYAQTYRAKQSFAFQFGTFGDPPSVTVNSGVLPGLTTVLTAQRAAAGTVCHSVTATILAQTASVAWDRKNSWYEVRLQGEAQDPVPTAAAGSLPFVGRPGAVVASASTPNLEWDLTFRMQQGKNIGWSTRAGYVLCGGGLDVSGRHFPRPAHFGGQSNLVHGTMMVRRFPSYVLYVTIGAGAGAVTVPLFFADASNRNFLEIVWPDTGPLRQLTW